MPRHLIESEAVLRSRETTLSRQASDDARVAAQRDAPERAIGHQPNVGGAAFAGETDGLHTFRVDLILALESLDIKAAADAAAWLAAVVVRDRRHLNCGAVLTAITIGQPVDAGEAVAYEAAEVAALRAPAAGRQLDPPARSPGFE